MDQKPRERRGVPRIAFTSPVIIRLKLHQVFGDARDLSPTGISILTYLCLVEVQSFVSRFVIPENGIVEVDGKVVHQTRHEDWNLIGVEFLDVPRRIKSAIHELVDQRRTGPRYQQSLGWFSGFRRA
jgi:hypothetical protein